MSKIAALDTNPGGVTVPVPSLTIPQSTPGTTGTLATTVLGWLLWGAGIIAIGFLIYGGILFVTSGGDADKATKARNTILYAVVGVIVITISYGLIMWANGLAQ